MAVATDFHRDFLIPENTVRQYARQRTDEAVQMLCVYSFVNKLYHINVIFSIEFQN